MNKGKEKTFDPSAIKKNYIIRPNKPIGRITNKLLSIISAMKAKDDGIPKVALKLCQQNISRSVRVTISPISRF